MTQQRPPELSTRLVGTSERTVVNRHLAYRQDEVEFPGNARGIYTYIDDAQPAVGIVPLESQWGARGVYLIRQERYPSQTVGWEIPAGGVGEDEDARQAGERELREEAGLTDVQNEIEVCEVITDADWFSMAQVEELMLDGEISAGHTLASLALTNAFLRRNPDHIIATLTAA